MATASHIIYEVNITVEDEIASAYKEWLYVHIRKMMKFDGFEAVDVFDLNEPAGESGKTQFVCIYRLRDQTSLDDYIKNHSAALRAEGIAAFGNRFSATRRVYSHAGISIRAL